MTEASLLRTFHEPRAVEPQAYDRLLWELPLLKPLRLIAFRRSTDTGQ